MLIGNLSSETKAFLFMCRVGVLRPPRFARWLFYTEKKSPVNWFAGIGQAVLKRALGWCWGWVCWILYWFAEDFVRGLVNGFANVRSPNAVDFFLSNFPTL